MTGKISWIYQSNWSWHFQVFCFIGTLYWQRSREIMHLVAPVCPSVTSLSLKGFRSLCHEHSLPVYAKSFLASPDISTFSPDIWLNLTAALRRTVWKFAGHVFAYFAYTALLNKVHNFFKVTSHEQPLVIPCIRSIVSHLMRGSQIQARYTHWRFWYTIAQENCWSTTSKWA